MSFHGTYCFVVTSIIVIIIPTIFQYFWSACVHLQGPLQCTGASNMVFVLDLEKW